jgi:hypothetical protein
MEVTKYINVYKYKHYYYIIIIYFSYNFTCKIKCKKWLNMCELDFSMLHHVESFYDIVQDK